MRRARVLGTAVGLALACASSDALALDLPEVGGAPLKLDVTATSIAAQRFSAREGEKPEDQGYFMWLNRLNLVLGWKKLTLGARIDSSLYALRPEDRAHDPSERATLVNDGSTRYRDSLYPAKLWLTYKDKGVEVTAGDSYVQFGRGLVLSMRKVDELGVDTTLFGGKATLQSDPFAVTFVAGVANPSRVDEPTGRALFPSRPVPQIGAFQPVPAQPLFGSDRLVGAQIQAGRGLPVVASTHAVRLTKCAPYRYDGEGDIIEDPFDAPFGTCEEPSRSTWLSELPATNLNPVLANPDTINAGQSIEVPSLWGHGSLYLEGAVQRRSPMTPDDEHTQGNALYASLVTTGGPIANTLEVKSYRNFFPLTGSVNITRASAFSNIAYSMPPTVEPITSDTMFGSFNVCVTGARDRFDYRFSPGFLAYGTFGYFVTRSEAVTGTCDRLGRSTSPLPEESTNYVSDASTGVEVLFDKDRSTLFANVSGRHDIKETGEPYYRELAVQYSLSKHIEGPYSFELSGRHRLRVQESENIRGESYAGEPWWEGEHQNALKIAPKWVISQGFEYTTFVGLPTYYINGGVLYKFTGDSNIRVYAGQNRGGVRCVSGVCRMFPAFSGARAELTLRF